MVMFSVVRITVSNVHASTGVVPTIVAMSMMTILVAIATIGNNGRRGESSSNHCGMTKREWRKEMAERRIRRLSGYIVSSLFPYSFALKMLIFK
jgi:hypothetical protein